jgi:hypothetical protein
MPYVTSIERLAREEGRKEGREEGQVRALQESILRMLKSKFNLAAATYTRKIRAEQGIKRLEAIHDAVACATSLDAVRALLK